MPGSPVSLPSQLLSLTTVPQMLPVHPVMVMPQLSALVVAVRPAQSVTWATYGKVPAWVGVPVTAPLVGLRVKPGGNDPEMIEKVQGVQPPLTTSVEE